MEGLLGLPCQCSHGMQAVGDALSGLLMVEAALRRRQWALQQWAALYQDLPSRQTKVVVTDRSVITTTNAETRVATPAGLQPLIDRAVAGILQILLFFLRRSDQAPRHC